MPTRADPARSSRKTSGLAAGWGELASDRSLTPEAPGRLFGVAPPGGTAAAAPAAVGGAWRSRVDADRSPAAPKRLEERGADGSVTAPSGAAPAASFGELARARTAQALDAVLVEARAVQSTVMPDDPALRRFRKALLELRSQVDLFAPAYAVGDNAAAWKELRRGLDAGYECIGRFKDLFDGRPRRKDLSRTPGAGSAEPDYPRKELARLREAMLAWRDGFFAAESLERARSLLAAPALQPGSVKRRIQSDFFWGGVKAKASPELSGLDNVARLARAQLGAAVRELDVVARLERLRSREDREAFHDVRKRLRAVANLLDAYPEILADAAGAAAPRAVLVDFINAYGKVEDRIVALEAARGADKKALAGRIDRRWGALRERQAREGLRAALSRLEQLLR